MSDKAQNAEVRTAGADGAADGAAAGTVVGAPSVSPLDPPGGPTDWDPVRHIEDLQNRFDDRGGNDFDDFDDPDGDLYVYGPDGGRPRDW